MSKLDVWKSERKTACQNLKKMNYRKAGGSSNYSNCKHSVLQKVIPHLVCRPVSESTAFPEMVSRKKVCDYHTDFIPAKTK